jgi:hypothetical protein
VAKAWLSWERCALTAGGQGPVGGADGGHAAAAVGRHAGAPVLQSLVALVLAGVCRASRVVVLSR